jgi:ribonuclease HIII
LKYLPNYGNLAYMQQTRVVTIPKGRVEIVKNSLLGQEERFIERQTKPPILWQIAADGLGVVTAYGSGKIVIQGNDNGWIDGIADMIEEENGSGGDSSLSIPRIGVDEAGKGDFFGPLVIGAVFVESVEQEVKLRTIGVRDSKTLSDRVISEIAAKIPDICSAHSIVSIEPVEYNKRYKERSNANVVLAQGHAQAIEDVLESIPEGACGLVVIDQFSKSKSRVLDELHENGGKMRVVQKHNGESDIAVAAASILARDRFVKGLAEMGRKYGMTFPKGASDVIRAGKEFVLIHGADELDNVAKTSFKTALQVTSTFDI